MMKIIWLPETKEDFRRLYAFIYPHNPEAAGKLIKLIFESSETIQHNPYIGVPYWEFPEFRDYIVRFGSRGYVLRYRIYKTDILISRIWHGRENR